ncbi:MAG TPA: MlaD family protein [Kofleriaceae bacterium]
MSDPRLGELPTPVSKRKRGRPSAVWIVPAIAIIAAVALGVRTYLRQGPTITITFENADGLIVGTSDVRYKNVPIGKIDAIDLTDDRREIVVTVKLERGAASLATKDTRFWVERPRVGVGGVSGLGTLLSGAYIGVDRGESTEKVDHFIGLEKPPGVMHDQVGTRFKIQAIDAGSLGVHSPVYLNRQQVGNITSLELSLDGRHVDIEVFIESPYDHDVTTTSVFWNTSGLDVQLDASGLHVDTQSLATVVAGGIAFGWRDGDPTGERAAKNAHFNLFEDRAHAMAKPDTLALPLAMRFHEALRGVNPGSVIDFEGIRIGQVDSIQPGYDTASKQFHSDVSATVYPERLGAAYQELAAEGQRMGKTGPQMLQLLVTRGLRAQLRSGNLLTGQFFIALVWGAPSKVPEKDGTWIVPTEKGGTDQIQDQVASIVAKIDKIPFDQIGGDVHQATQAASSLLGHLDHDVVPNAQALVAKADAAMAALRESLASIRDNVAAPDSAIQQSTRATMEQLENAARSLRGLTDYLQHHPESIVRGRDSGSEPK